ncbi:GAF domain-containing protein [Flammeovirga kamogawensis]|uniref:GAF domain-containing protein n=1 Tax=Flammeovirga kamogawensis TaxID=373891 RepID=A0ABX8GVK4_9BACT|nr:GAF domain-containing protein [Flammeovirga kamogawensis]MBB6461644.1 hypothetical protein [Flammeovirga kamogawensis]QWG07429.1 GAF domain-containing protein [Flammeovirga kamogawensis]TRX69240.1 GAF domain-containing protein [Flammeovirga kamogawensis]
MKTAQKRTNIRDKAIHTVYRKPAIIFAGLGIFVFTLILILENQYPNILSLVGILDTKEFNRDAYIQTLQYIDLMFIIGMIYLYAKNSKTFNLTLGIVFLLLSFHAISEIYELPIKILNHLEISDDKIIVQVKEVSSTTFYTVGFTFAVLVFLLFRLISDLMQDPEDQIIYVPKYFSKDNQNHESELRDSFDERASLIKKNIQSAIINIGDEDKEQKLLNAICKEFQVSTGIYYKSMNVDGKDMIQYSKGFSFYLPDSKMLMFEFGEGLPGQVAKTRTSIISNAIPDNYIRVVSGLGDSSPKSLMISPILDADQNLLGVVELSSFKTFTPEDREILDKVTVWFTEN